MQRCPGQRQAAFYGSRAPRQDSQDAQTTPVRIPIGFGFGNQTAAYLCRTSFHLVPGVCAFLAARPQITFGGYSAVKQASSLSLDRGLMLLASASQQCHQPLIEPAHLLSTSANN